jgi:hypothetical protein
MHKLYVDECVKSAEEPISLRAPLDIFTKEFNFNFGHTSLDTCKFFSEWAMNIEAAGASHESSKLRVECDLNLRKAQLTQDRMKKISGMRRMVTILWS